MKIKIVSKRVKGGTNHTVEETVLVDGEEVGSASYWPDSAASAEAHERVMSAMLAKTGATQDEIDQAYIDQWNS